MGLLFQDWGLTTVDALTQARSVLNAHADRTTLISSGGMRSGIDMAKSLALGAHMCGVAAPLLSAAQESKDAVIDRIDRLHREFKTALFLLGCADCSALIGNDALVQ